MEVILEFHIEAFLGQGGVGQILITDDVSVQLLLDTLINPLSESMSPVLVQSITQVLCHKLSADCHHKSQHQDGRE